MKAMYKQPNVEISEVKPTSIICASITPGNNTSQQPGDPVGD